LRHAPSRAAAPALPFHVGEKCIIAHSDLVYALSQLDSFIDVSEEDLLQIYALAVRAANEPVAAHTQRSAVTSP
jgi:hypothetical protein